MRPVSLLDNVIHYLIIALGSLILAVAIVAFMVPADIVPTGVTGAAAIINSLFGIPIGVQFFLYNIPILYLGYRMLPGGWRMLMDVAIGVMCFSLFVDLIGPFLPVGGYSDDRLLNAILGGVVSGIGYGLVFRTGTNFAGTTTIALIIQRRVGMPLSQIYLYTDTSVIVAAALLYGVEGALYAFIAMFLSGLASDYVMEGPGVIRTAFVITEKPTEVSQSIMNGLYRGVTYLPARGMYSGKDKAMLYITISRSQVNELKNAVALADDAAFIVIGQGHAAYGPGFKPVVTKPRQIPKMKHPFPAKNPPPPTVTVYATADETAPAETYPAAVD
jgi:uncharacterized membrane-anchored protein YitT (DUF2179 family)